MTNWIIYISGAILCVIVALFIQIFLKLVFRYKSKRISIWIGILERLLLFVVIVLSGQFGIVGWVLGAKAVARFSKAIDSKESGIYFVGTLLSILFGLTIAIITRDLTVK
ncbi:hypothetical protein J7L68_07890 [bacterium]|nr:hypothetical protein [bacterium]